MGPVYKTKLLPLSFPFFFFTSTFLLKLHRCTLCFIHSKNFFGLKCLSNVLSASIFPLINQCLPSRHMVSLVSANLTILSPSGPRPCFTVPVPIYWCRSVLRKAPRLKHLLLENLVVVPYPVPNRLWRALQSPLTRLWPGVRQPRSLTVMTGMMGTEVQVPVVRAAMLRKMMTVQ